MPAPPCEMQPPGANGASAVECPRAGDYSHGQGERREASEGLNVRQLLSISWLRRMALLSSAGSLFFLDSCDPTLRTTVENGIISASNSLLASILQALVELGAEAGA